MGDGKSVIGDREWAMGFPECATGVPTCSSPVHVARGAPPMARSPFPIARSNGFTLVELLVVLAIVALLLSIAAPRYFGSVDRSREAVLKENLFLMRDAIDQYHADKGRYPPSLEALVAEKYLRRVPLDPVTESTASWIALAPGGEAGGAGGVFDVRSGAEGRARDGTAYGEW